MAYRTRLLLFLSVACLTLMFTNCAYNQQTAFRNAFLPAPAQPAPVAEVAPAPPAVAPNPYLVSVPKLIEGVPVSAAGRVETQMQKAEQHFQRGKKFYQAKDVENARREFDVAVDTMLEASDSAIPDRSAYESRLERMLDAIHGYDLAGLGASEEMATARFEKAPLEDILNMTFPVDPNLKNRVQEQLQATVSQLPLSQNDAVISYINYFSGRGRKTLIAGLERSGRYKPLIQRILDEEGIPQELIHLAQAESGFLPRAVSRKAAVGMWQFVAWRGRQYGLMQTRSTDDRLDPEKATRAAARHLRDLYNRFGDWYLAVAAYNCGPGVVEKAVERTGYADFWELRRLHVLPAETTNYVPIILAMTIMDKHAAEYGLLDVTPDRPIEYDSMEVTSPTHMQLIADLTDTPISVLAELNPALLKAVAPEGYTLHVPKGKGSALMASLQLIPAERRASWRMHRVASGETLAAIGKRYGLTPGRIAAANGLDSDTPAAGRQLLIPAAYTGGEPFRQKTRSAQRKGPHSASKRKSSVRGVTVRSQSGTHIKAGSKQRRNAPAVLTRTASNGHRRASANN